MKWGIEIEKVIDKWTTNTKRFLPKLVNFDRWISFVSI